MSTIAVCGVVELVSCRHCFAGGVNFPTASVSNVPVLSVEKADGFCVFLGKENGLPSRVSAQNSSAAVRIDRKLGTRIGLDNGDKVMIRQLNQTMSCSRAYLEPLSADDWEIVELHASFVEQQLLDQIRVLFVGLVFPFWVNASTVIYFRTVSVEPRASCVILEQYTEVSISPKLPDKQSYGEATSSLLATNSSFLTSFGAGSNHSTAAPPDLRQPSAHLGVDQQNLLTVSDGEDSTSSPTVDEVGSDGSDSELRAVATNSTMNTGYMKSMRDHWKSWSSTRWLSQTVRDWQKTLRDGNWTPLGLEGGEWASTSTQPDVDRAEPLVASDNQVECDVADLLQECSFNRIVRVQGAVVTHNESGQEVSSSRVSCACQGQPNAALISCATWRHLQRHAENEREATDSQPCSHDCGVSSGIAQLSDLHAAVVKEQNGIAQDGQTASRISAVKPLSEGQPYVGADSVVRVHAVCVHSRADPLVAPGHVVLTPAFRRLKCISSCSRVRLKSWVGNCSTLKGVVLTPLSPLPVGLPTSSVQEAFVDWLCSSTSCGHPWPVGSLGLCSLQLADKASVDVAVECFGVLRSSTWGRQVEEAALFLLDEAALRSVRIVVREPMAGSGLESLQLAKLRATEVEKEPRLCSFDRLGGVQSQAEIGLTHLKTALQPLRFANSAAHSFSNGMAFGGILVCGSVRTSGSSVNSSSEEGVARLQPASSSGCGTTSVAEALCSAVQQPPVLAFVAVLQCSTLRGKRPSAVLTKFADILHTAEQRQPAVVLLDNLDHLIPAVGTSPEAVEGAVATQLAYGLRDLMRELIASRHRVVLIGTAQCQDSLHASLLPAPGSHCFQTSITLSPPNQEARQSILTAILNQAGRAASPPDVDVKQLAAKTEGFLPGDLVSVVDRAVHSSAVRTLGQTSDESVPGTVCREDFQTALDGYTPVVLRGVQQANLGSRTSWDDIGGLDDVKATLRRSLEWPAKFPKLFARSPIRMASGLLLYGPPGTGKTLIARAVAHECNVNLISVKGPELLNKYIGASEQAVRDVMARAQAAKPCVVFFDEFDALAPRRGHDSTGVTDRVVNQLLTQLDGVEGREGVFVLAATSRPDLIDPALLRPGRIGKSLLCPLPNERSRSAILHCLLRGVPFGDDVDVSQLVAATKHFSGADLRALLYNAQLAALNERQTAQCEPCEERLLINQAHLLRALEMTRPSVSSAERLRFEQIYSNFAKSRSGRQVERTMPEQRATLA